MDLMMMHRPSLGTPVLLSVLLLGGCGTLLQSAQGPAPVERRQEQPSVRPPQPASPPEAASSPVSQPGVSQQPLPELPPPVLPPPAPLLIPPPVPLPQALHGRALAEALLPPAVRDRAGWATDIAAAVEALGLPGNGENYCAAMAVTEQVSSFQADPVVPGLAAIAWKEIETRRQRYHIPKLALDAALARTSPNGRSYRQRIDSLRTEKQMSLLYSDIIEGLPFGRQLLSGYNPVRTGGPMQVSVAFAREHARDNAYAAALVREAGGDVRSAVFSRKGGLYFGIAHLLDYPASYREARYRFADFNAGRYSSRNAAFQQALVQLTRVEMDLDGDLLDYGGKASATWQAARKLARRLGLSDGEILASLKLEKSEAFGRTQLYQKVMSMADGAAGRHLPREILPRIRLQSPKIHSKLTTAWFAEKVDGRYRQCLQRAANLAEAARER